MTDQPPGAHGYPIDWTCPDCGGHPLPYRPAGEPESTLHRCPQVRPPKKVRHSTDDDDFGPGVR